MPDIVNVTGNHSVPVDSAQYSLAEEYYQTARRSYQKAAADSQATNYYFRLAGFVIHLQCVGLGLGATVARALEPVMCPPTVEPDLTIHMWDSAATQTEPLDPPRSSRGRGLFVLGRGEVEGFVTPTIKTFYQIDSQCLSILHLKQSAAFVWVPDARRLTGSFYAAPFYSVINAWMSVRGFQVVHAGAVGTSSGGALIVGDGGFGKSTTTLSCLGSQLRYAADDYCLVGTAEDPKAFNLYQSAKIRSSQLSSLPSLGGNLPPMFDSDSGKVVLFVGDLSSDDLIQEFPIRAILLARITGTRNTNLRPSSPAEVLMGWVPSTIRQLPDAGQEAVILMASVTRQASTFVLELGTDLSQIPGVIVSGLEHCTKRQ